MDEGPLHVRKPREGRLAFVRVVIKVAIPLRNKFMHSIIQYEKESYVDVHDDDSAVNRRLRVIQSVQD